jgi:hypothetical protein
MGREKYQSLAEANVFDFKGSEYKIVTGLSIFIGFICISIGVELRSPAAGYAGMIHFLIAMYCYGIVVFRGANDDPFTEALDKLEKAEHRAMAWEQEAKTIWSHISNESPVARGTISNTMRAAIIRRDNCTCTYCGHKGTATADSAGRA